MDNFDITQEAVLRRIADEEAIRNPIFYKGEFREGDWFSLLNSGELISKNALRNQEGVEGYSRIEHQINRLGWATLEQIENCRWAITPEGLERVLEEIKKDERASYTVATKSDEFDDMIDEIAAEHKKTSAPLDHISDYGDKEEAALWRIMNGLCVILFETPTDYCDFRIKYSDRLLLPKPESIYGKHPEILEHDWPVVIYVEFAPCSNYGGNCRYTGNIAWAIAQSDWRETKTVDGKNIYIYGEKEWA